MRCRLFVLFFALPAFAFAQKGEPYYYQQNAIQAPILDCYHKNLDLGVVARDRGDCSGALKFFREARECVEAKDNLRRISELDDLIEQCENPPKTAKIADATVKNTRPRPETNEPARRYLPSLQFLYFKGDTCFTITRREGDRAFAQRCWDDAAKLYRAAKSCTDADQNERAFMNARLTACRNAAEDELRQKEQEAIRLARHAIANNLADDAQDQLRLLNRSLAYRLADFANEYVAPDDNPQCIQALLDSWYFVPSVYSGIANKDMLVPFCYQLAGNMPSNVIIRCMGKGKSARIYVLAPDNDMLYSWDANTFEPQEPIKVEEHVFDFDVSPDGRTLLFISDDNYIFWRTPKQFIKVPAGYATAWSFSPRGDAFYAYNPDAQTIYVVGLKDAFTMRKGPARSPVFSSYITGLQADLKTFITDDGAFWLGYSDRIEVLRKPEHGQRWVREQVIRFGQNLVDYRSLTLYPVAHKAVMSGDSTLIFNLPESGISVDGLLPATTLAGEVLASHEKSGQIVNMIKNTNGQYDHFLVSSLENGTWRYGTYLNAEDWISYTPGAFSSDGRWLLAVSNNGILNAWDLSSNQAKAATILDQAYSVNLSPTGRRLVVEKTGQLEVMETSDLQKPFHKVPVSIRNFELKSVCDDWIAYRDGRDSVLLHQVSTDRTLYFPINLEGGAKLPLAFSADEQTVAYTDSENSITVRSLANGAVLGAKTFDESVSELRFVPNSSDIVVVQVDKNAFSQIDQNTVAKIWNYARPMSKARVVRLHGYKIEYVELTALGDYVAFSDGGDIRIFRMDNLSDEITRIHRLRSLVLSSMAFSPDGKSVAAGYEDGSVIFWGIQQGEILFKLPPSSQYGDPKARDLGFVDNGQRLQQVSMDQTYTVRDLSPAIIRAQVQDEYHLLLSFTPEQIREYELEKALNYPGNFERLAESKEWPLIRSFFEYFYQQSMRSNNIAQVEEYCQRASILYQQLDAGTQQTLRRTMLEMYRDLNWKWLLRGGTAQAAAVVEYVERNFDDPLVAVEAGAFTALQNGELKKATRLFTDLTVRSHEKIKPEDYASWSLLDTLKTKFRQLAEYDLLEAPQIACICGMYAELIDIHNLCPGTTDISAVPFDSETRLRWNIFQNLYKAQGVSHHEQKALLLQSALEDARVLQRQKAPNARAQLERVILEVAKNQLSRGIFERGNVLTEQYFRETINLLANLGPSAPKYDSTRLALLAYTQSSLGKYYLNKDDIAMATGALGQGLQTVNQLLVSLRDTSDKVSYQSTLQASLYAQLGAAYLLNDKPDAARSVFEQAMAFSYNQNNFNNGHIALLEGHETEAFIEYGNIYEAADLAQALFDIERFAARFADKRDTLRAFLPRLKTAAIATKKLNPGLVDYWFAKKKAEFFAARETWDSTLAWSSIALNITEKALNQANPSTDWKNFWLDELLYQSYYLTMVNWRDTSVLSQAIRYAEQARKYVRDFYSTYSNRDYLYTNLAHAYWLRNLPGDREKAIEAYRSFLAAQPFYGVDNREVLQKDLRDFIHAGVQWPQLDELKAVINGQ